MNEVRGPRFERTRGAPFKLGIWASWEVLSALTIVFVTSRLQLGANFWQLSPNDGAYVGSLALAYLLASLILSWKMFWIRETRLKDVFISVSVAYALCGFCLFLASFGTYSRRVFVTALAASYILAALPLVLKRNLYRFAVLIVLVSAGGMFPGRISIGDTPSVERRFESTALYNVALTIHRGVVPSEVTGGAIEAFGTGFLVASGDGALYYFEEPQKDPLVVRTLASRIPINRDEFLKDKTDEVADQFRVADIMLRVDGQRFSLFASHHYWKRDGQCYVARVSATQGDRESLLKGTVEFEWRTVYDTKPCLPLNSTRLLFVGVQIGGRLAWLDEQTFLLAVGDGEFDGWNSKLNLPQDVAADWGKTIRVNANSGMAAIYTSGHRNPQGLYATPDGKVWLTEHGPQGGDELNFLVEGANYGWPFVTYGTEYGTLVWPLNEDQGRHSGYEPPVLAWVPSIGVTNLIGIQKDLFNLWRGDLLVGSLRDRTLFRIRMEGDRTAYVEPIMKIGLGIRDLVEGQDGRIGLLFDGGDIGVLEAIPADPDTLETSNKSELDGLLLGQCKGCHPIGDGTTHGIGPDLRGVVGRRVASASGYNYSPALRELSGRWTRERLDKFLENPVEYAPGTTMETDILPDGGARKKLIEYLSTQN